MAPVQPGEPKTSPKPEPIGNYPFVILVTTCTLCLLFILWRRAHGLRRVVSQRLGLKTLSGSSASEEGQIRLSEDDGPSSTSFLTPDDYDDDNEHLTYNDNESLSAHMKRVTNAWREPTIPPALLASEGQADSNSSASAPSPAPAPATPLVKLEDSGSPSTLRS
ncbi:hypothetical protein H1R20_g6603, partial [Candolleomyces eurysporus]